MNRKGVSYDVGRVMGGPFVFQFVSQITPYSDDPRHDLDMASSSLVKYSDVGKHGKHTLTRLGSLRSLLGQ